MSDRRTKMSKKILHETLVELLSEMPLSRVTIKELCGRADLNRSTFYAHYQTIDDLYTEIENDFLMRMVYQDNLGKPQVMINKLTGLAEYIRANQNTFFALMNNGSFNTRCAERAKRIMAENNYSGRKTAESVSDLLTSYSVVGANALLSEWLRKQQDIPAEKIAVLLYNINKALAAAD